MVYEEFFSHSYKGRCDNLPHTVKLLQCSIGRNCIPHSSAIGTSTFLIANLEHVLVDAKGRAFSTVEVHDLRVEARFLHLVLEIL